MSEQQPDWILQAGHVLTQGPLGELRDAAVAVQGDSIVDIGPSEELLVKYLDVPVLGTPEGILIPGLINTHTHFSEGLITGMGEQWTVWEWGQQLLGPVGLCLTPEMAEVGTLLRGAELIASGVTTVSDMFCHAQVDTFSSLGVVDGLKQLGMRGVVSFGAEDNFGGCQQTIARITREHEALAAHAAAAERIHFRLGVGTVLGQTDALFQRTIELSQANDWAIHTHLAEVREEKVTARLRWNRSTVEHAAAMGLFERPTLAAHGIWLSGDEIKLLAEYDVQVVYNPQANMILGSGVCNVEQLHQAGITVSLGTDGAASNDSQNLLETLKLGALLQKVNRLEPSTLLAQDVLRMATLGAAQSLGLDKQIGSIEVGKQADLTYFSGQSPGTAIVHDPAQQIVYGASPQDVSDVWVAGRHILAQGKLQTLSLTSILQRARPLAKTLAEKANLQSLSCLTSSS